MLSAEDLKFLLPFKPGDKVIANSSEFINNCEFIVVAPCGCGRGGYGLCYAIITKSILHGRVYTIERNVLQLVEDQIGKCIKCGQTNEYQTGPFTCWSCK